MPGTIAYKAFGIPWDQLGGLPGQGLRFDYRGQVNGFDGIFESKGTSYRSNQSKQINHGIQKKEAHHQRGDTLDVELIVSTFVGRGDDQPGILVGDPDFDELAKIYEIADKRFFRLRHYVRILQFIGLSQSAFALNKYAKAYLKGERILAETILAEKHDEDYLDVERFGEYRYFGRWFERVLPKGSKRWNKKRYGEEALSFIDTGIRPKVFQGLREDIYKAGIGGEPFTQELLTQDEIRMDKEMIDKPVSIFADGTIQVFKL